MSSFGSTCQDVSFFDRGAIYIHTFYFLVLAAKMFHLSVGEPYTCILFILSFNEFLLPRCVIFR